MANRRASWCSILIAAASLAPISAACTPPSPSGTTCWEKRTLYQARNPGLRETLGSGTRYSSRCVLSAYLAIEQAAVEFGVTRLIDTMVRIAACESLLQPTMIGIKDPADIGLFQWNEKPPRYWWTTIRRAFNAWQDTHAARTGDSSTPHYATTDRTDPYNAARVAAWLIMTHPRTWPITWLCKGIYDPTAGRIR